MAKSTITARVHHSIERVLQARAAELGAERTPSAHTIAAIATQAAMQHVVAILECMNDAYIAVDPSWNVTYMNAHAEAFLGKSFGDLSGKSLWAEVPELDAGGLRRYFEEAWYSHASVSFNFHAPNMRRWIEGQVAPLEDGIICCCRDITAQKTAELSADRNKKMLAYAQQTANLGNWDWEIATNILTWSGQMYRIYGLPGDAPPITYQHFSTLVHPADWNDLQQYIGKALESHEPLEFDHRIIRPDGEVRTLNGRGEVLLGPDGKPERVIGTSQDITDRVRIAEERLYLLMAEQRARAEVERQKQRLNSILIEFTAPVVTIREPGHIVEFFNPAAEALLGSRIAAGKPLSDVLPAATAAEMDAILEWVYRTRSEFCATEMLLQVWGPDGLPRDGYFSFTLKPITGDDDSVVSVLGSGFDVTEQVTIRHRLEALAEERRAAAEEIERLNTDLQNRIGELESLIEVIPAGIGIALDPECRYIRSNPAFADILQIPYGANASRTPPDGEQPAAFRAFCDGHELEPKDLPMQVAARSGCEVHNFELQVLRVDGTRIDLLSHAMPLFDDNHQTRGSIGVFVDISDRKQLEQTLKKFNEQLEARVAERTRELTMLNRELNAFSYSVAHDLRAPLRTINGMAGILLEDYSAGLAAEAFACLHSIKRSALDLGKLVDNLLEFSRLSRKAFSTGVVDMDTIVSASLEETRRLFPNHNPSVVVHRLPSARGDESMLRLVWTNLLSNALKFTQKTPQPHIEVFYNDGAYHVRDNGAGFDMQYAAKLFGVFQRLHSDADYEGTGVGLAIVQRIIERHNGKVWAIGQEGKGATFSFMIGTEASEAET